MDCVQMDEPATITDFTLTSDRNTIHVDWEPEGSVCINKEYQVELQLLNVLSCQNTTLTSEIYNTTSTSLSITVKYHSIYAVYITTILNGTYGNRSLGRSETVPIGEPSKPPENVTTKMVTADSITFQWLEPPCDKRNGLIMSYSYILTDESNGQMIANSTTNSTSVTIGDLRPCTTYNFTINATNDAGMGPPFTLQSKTEATEPGPVTAFNVTATKMHSELLTTWKPSSENCRETGYHISAQLTDKDQCESIAISNQTDVIYINASDTILTSKFTNLLTYSTYNITITASNPVGIGRGISLAQTTNISAPSAPPSNVSVESITSRSITIEWSEPPCGNRHGPIIGYSYSLYNETSDEIITSTGLNTTVTINDLTPYTTYTFVITALTNAGKGPLYNLTQRTNDTVPFAPPSNVTITSVTSSNITFEWSAPPSEHRHGPIGYSYSLYDDIGNKIVTSTGRNTSVTINNLTPYTNYTFIISASTNAGKGPSYNLTQRTNESAPTAPPSNVTITSVTSTCITLKWSKPPIGHRHGPIIAYSYSLYDDIGDENITSTTTNATVTINDLTPYTAYTFVISASTNAGKGPSYNLTERTSDTVPTAPPSNITITSVTSSNISFEWSEPSFEHKHGPITYSYSLYNESSDEIVTSTGQNTSVTINELIPFTNYTFIISASTNAGEGPSYNLTQRTNESEPSEPANLKFEKIAKRSLTVSWSNPTQPNGIITHFTVENRITAKPYDRYFNVAVDHETKIIDRVQELRLNINDLEPSTEYEIRVYAHTKIGRGPPISGSVFTKPATIEDIQVPDDLPTYDESLITASTVVMRLQRSTTEFVTSYQVGVQINSATTKRESLQFGHTMYIAAEFPKENMKDNFTFVVGDNGTYGGYWNPPLQADSSYILRTGYVSEFDKISVTAWSDGFSVSTLPPKISSSNQDSSTPPWVPVICILVILVLVVALLGLIVMKRRNMNRGSKEEDENAISLTEQQQHDTSQSAAGTKNNVYELETNASQPNSVASGSSTPKATPKPKPTLSDDSPAKSTPIPRPIIVESFHAYVLAKKENDSFKIEYETLPGDNLHTSSTAKDPQNKKKNRYGNIIAYDHSRVVLNPLDNVPRSDYINANFIDIKCDQYWPEKATQYGDVTVIPTGEEKFDDYVIRTFTIQPVTDGEVRMVSQYHFTSWPDMGVPQAPPLLRFMKRVDKDIFENAGPMIVHCSAGVGRTGSYLVIKAMMEQAKQEGAVDVYSYVSKMRNNRMKMVQTALQYQFIFDVLLEALICDDTSIHKDSFEEEFTKLKKINPKTKKSRIEEQFQVFE
ncbi:receptor-type tyrosine-protein phosphatase F-like [Amphiura filiformis]|uniref:receptor-type tyrosine-protein phosphatase F-like n=1 Tax=Amphiura filiformis TaxID=82378 RepID=UPI003B21EDF3